MKRTALFLFALAALFGEDKTPTIPDTQKTAYISAELAVWKAQAAFDKGLSEDQKKLVQALMMAVQERDRAANALTCGDKHQPALDQSGVPYCTPKEVIAKSELKK